MPKTQKHKNIKARKHERKKVVRKKKTLLKLAPIIDVEELLSEKSLTHKIIPESVKNLAKLINIRTTSMPPLSPYVVSFEAEKQESVIKTVLKENIAPTLAEEIKNEKEFAPKKTVLNGDRQVFFKAMTEFFFKKKFFLKQRFKFLFEAGKSRKISVQKKKVKEKLKVRMPYFSNPAKLFRGALSFALLAGIFILPASGFSAYGQFEQTKNDLTWRGFEAIREIKGISGNLIDAPQALDRANYKFLQAKNQLDEASGVLGKILPMVPKAGNSFESASLLLDAGSHLTEAGKILTEGLASVFENEPTLTTSLLKLDEAVRSAFPLIVAADLELGAVSENSLPQNVRPAIILLRQTVVEIRSSFSLTIDLLPAIEDFLGIDKTKRYLVIFQNSNELRPSGGFIGSYALVDIDRGSLEIIDIPDGGPYDLSCCLTEHVISPQPLHLIEPHWQFHDANWFADFPATAKKLIWFYEKSGGPSVDGVIAVNSAVIPELLKVFGPIEMPEYGRVFTADNFISETQKIVEKEYDRILNKPKKFIGEVAPILLRKILETDKNQILNVSEIFGNALLTKDIQLYADADDVQSAFAKAGWTGELHKTDGDYLSVNIANIAGGKTNGVLDTVINHEAEIAGDGGVIDTVSLTQTHKGVLGDQFSGVRSVEYVRFFVPKGSELLSADGFEPPPQELFKTPDADYRVDSDLAGLDINVRKDPVSRMEIMEEFGKTVFGNWLQIDPGAVKTVKITYRLPWKIINQDDNIASRVGSFVGLPKFFTYSFFAEKQSGLKSDLNSTINFSDKFKVNWKTGDFLSNKSGQYQTSRAFNGNKFSALLFAY